MMEIKDIRRINLERMRLECDPPTWEQLSKTTGVGANYFSQVRSKGKHPRNIGHSVARRLEVAMRKPKGWMEELHTDEKTEAMPTDGDRIDFAIRSIPGVTPEEAELLAKILRGIRSSNG